LTKATDVVTIKSICFSYYIGPYGSIYASDASAHAEIYLHMFLAKTGKPVQLVKSC